MFEANDVTCFVQGAAQAGFNIDTIHAIADKSSLASRRRHTRRSAWTDPSIVQAFSLWKQLFDEGIIQAGALGQTSTPRPITTSWRRAAMVMMGTWTRRTWAGRQRGVDGGRRFNRRAVHDAPHRLPGHRRHR